MIKERRVCVGPELGSMLDAAIGARLPVLLMGTHGIGKSEYLERYATDRGMTPYVLDLSLLEATDLAGMPFLDNGLTHFAHPATLPPPDDDRPILLVLEELNRCDRSVRQPCLQLLTARRLNQYRLPQDCTIVACANPVERGYDVDELDDALMSRFVVFELQTDRNVWLDWAKGARIHPAVIDIIARYPYAFQAAPPRTWTHAARLLTASLDRRQDLKTTEQVLCSVLPALAARSVISSLTGAPDEFPTPEAILAAPLDFVGWMRDLTRDRRLDLIKHVVDQLEEHLAAHHADGIASPGMREGLVRLLKEAPADLTTRITAVVGARDDRRSRGRDAFSTTEMDLRRRVR